MVNNSPAQNYNALHKPASDTGGLILSISVLAMYLVSLIFGLIIQGVEDMPADLSLYLSYLAAPIGITAAVFGTLRYKNVQFKSVFPVSCHPKYYLIGVLFIFGLLFSVSMIDAPVLELFKALGYEERGAESYFPDLSGANVLIALIIIAVIPALVEETLFRGVILNACEESMGTIRTIFVVGFCFALFHASPEQTVYQFIAGCAFALIAVRSGSILPSIVMHFINNALIIIFAACGLYDEAGALIMSDDAFLVVTVLSAASFIVAVGLLIKDSKPWKKGREGGVAQFFLFASVGIVILAVSWVLSFFVIE
ncbi:MAG: CPBP family intramembrane metalloprotease [Clostridia bacterium]|nr:CPBP family intramembrane metalloprotease [Clostridia bacterium]